MPVILFGDVLGHVFSFMETYELIRTCTLVNREWNYVLKTLPHSWGNTLMLNPQAMLYAYRPHEQSFPYAWQRIIRLEYHRLWPDRILIHLSKILINLREISFNGNCLITGNSLHHLSKLPIVHISFHDCRQISDSSLVALKGLKLKYLDLFKCSKLSDESVQKHISQFPLEYLSVRLCQRITFESIKYLPRSLKYLDFYGHGLNGDKAHQFEQSNLNLERLSIRGGNINEQILRFLLRMTNLKCLNIINIISYDKEIVEDMLRPTLCDMIGYEYTQSFSFSHHICFTNCMQRIEIFNHARSI